MASNLTELARTDGTYDVLGKDAWEALLRMEGTSGGIVRRILYWLNHEPSLTMEDLQCLYQDITALGRIHINNPEPWVESVRYYLKNPEARQVIYPGPDKRGIMRFMEIMLDCFQTLADTQKTQAKVGPLQCCFYISKRGKKSPITKDLSTDTETMIDGAIFKVIKALQACGALIARCPECRMMFLADRINQVYCTLKCQNRATSRTYYLKQKKLQKGKKSQGTKSTGKNK